MEASLSRPSTTMSFEECLEWDLLLPSQFHHKCILNGQFHALSHQLLVGSAEIHLSHSSPEQDSLFFSGPSHLWWWTSTALGHHAPFFGASACNILNAESAASCCAFSWNLSKFYVVLRCVLLWFDCRRHRKLCKIKKAPMFRSILIFSWFKYMLNSFPNWEDD